MGFSPSSLRDGGAELARHPRAVGDLDVPREPPARRRWLSTHTSSCRRIYSPLGLAWLLASSRQRAAKAPLGSFGSRAGEGLSLPPQAPQQPFGSGPRLRWRARTGGPGCLLPETGEPRASPKAGSCLFLLHASVCRAVLTERSRLLTLKASLDLSCLPESGGEKSRGDRLRPDVCGNVTEDAANCCVQLGASWHHRFTFI